MDAITPYPVGTKLTTDYNKRIQKVTVVKVLTGQISETGILYGVSPPLNDYGEQLYDHNWFKPVDPPAK